MTEPRPPFTPSPPLGAERVGVRWGIPERSPTPTSPSRRCATGPSLSALKGGERIYGRPQTGLELRTGCGVWVRVCVAAIETISTVVSYNE